ncbi:MAG: hypothetical protein PHO02_02310 [Candidatus Nanoarchaeia archaeon]|nr:hypothetical protein [Candidatus Nanoarchaeia archaeon]
MDRLFVPLCTQPFLDFKHNGKKYELRACKGRFSQKHVYANRKVEIRRGYSGESIWGTIGNSVAGDLNEILKKINFKEIIPSADSEKEAISKIKAYLGEQSEYIAFEIIFWAPFNAS